MYVYNAGRAAPGAAEPATFPCRAFGSDVLLHNGFYIL